MTRLPFFKGIYFCYEGKEVRKGGRGREGKGREEKKRKEKRREEKRREEKGREVYKRARKEIG